VPFDVLQSMLSMDAHEEVDPDTNAKPDPRPARATSRFRPCPGRTSYDLKAEVQKEVDKVIAAHQSPSITRSRRDVGRSQPSSSARSRRKIAGDDPVRADQHRGRVPDSLYLLHDRVEKTKDIGIIKSVGATNAGVAGIFLGYVLRSASSARVSACCSGIESFTTSTGFTTRCSS